MLLPGVLLSAKHDFSGAGNNNYMSNLLNSARRLKLAAGNTKIFRGRCGFFVAPLPVVSNAASKRSKSRL